MIRNPILPGFHSDPCICRNGGDYYIACSSFEWFPGVPVYHSRDLKHWELYTHILTDDNKVMLTGLPSSKGIWAPCLSWCDADGLFYLVYGIMHSMNARYFDVDNYVITAPDIRGPWSEPVYLHSAGFDASMFHDADGRKWLVSLEWETRDSYSKPGGICMAEYDPTSQSLVGYPKRIWHGATDRGCLEAPHLYRHGDYYYIMCAEGGTGYYHSVTMGRSKNIWGPYEADPAGPILTSNTLERDERSDVDHLKPHYYAPEASLQKVGHGSITETETGETYLAYHCSRPFVPELCCTLGREAAIERMEWTEDGWLRRQGGGKVPGLFTAESALPDYPVPPIPEFDDFDQDSLGIQYYAPRMDPRRFTDLTSRPGWLRMRGQESGSSLHQVSLLARVLTSIHSVISTRMEFTPECYQHSAGLILFYDNMNYAYLRKYHSETLGGSAISIIRVENGCKRDWPGTRIPVGDEILCFRLIIDGRHAQFQWAPDGAPYQNIGPAFETAKFSDEYCKYGEFTGTMVGITCADRMYHRKYADFDYFCYQADETRHKSKNEGEK